jgi:hypothetical protein
MAAYNTENLNETAGNLRFPSTHDIPIVTLIDDPQAPFEESHDWQYIHEALAVTLDAPQSELEAKVFEFKSLQIEGLTDALKQELISRDSAAAQELQEMYPGHFYRYHAGEIVDRRARSFCIWDSEEFAAEAIQKSEKHKLAARLAIEAYGRDGMQVSWHRLHISRATGAVALESIK